MKAMVMPNFDKQNAAECTKNVCEKLIELKIELLMAENCKAQVDFSQVEFGNFYQQLQNCDLLIAIGGDGTIIHSAKHAVEFGKPVLGINAGRLGFLAGLEQNELNYLEHLANQQYQIEERMMLEVTHHSQSGEISYFALNDAVISKGALARVIDLDIYCMNRYVSSYRADGVIFSTPTGSTAYALSAGGPIIEPKIDAIGMTPISPHSLFDRTILFSAESFLTLKLGIENTGSAYLTVDGEEGIPLQQDDWLSIQKRPVSVKMIRLCEKPFYEVLNQKFLVRAKENSI